MLKKIKQKLNRGDKDGKAASPSSATKSRFSQGGQTSYEDPRVTQARRNFEHEIARDGLKRPDESMEAAIDRLKQEFIDHWKDRNPEIAHRDPQDRISDLIFRGTSDKSKTNIASPSATASDRTQALIENALEERLRPKPPPTHKVTEIRPAELEPYSYTPFDDPFSIRLLHFFEDEYELPNHGTQKLCSLETFPLESAPEYLALSYTWGHPFNDAECTVSYAESREWIITSSTTEATVPCRINIGRNLYEALQKITKSKSTTRYIWIDALCIDQSDLDERASQVSMMGDIYTRCARVIVWLGDMNPREAAEIWILHFTVLPEIAKYIAVAGAEAIKTGDWTEQDMKERFGLGRSVGQRQWNAYQRFFERVRWFSRAWVFQEIALAPKAIILFAHLQLEFAEMTLLAHFLRVSGLSDEVFEPGNAGATSPGAMIENLHQIQQAVSVMRAPGGVEMMATNLGLTDVSRTIWQFFFNCIRSLRSAQCTDPRDKVFAALGFLHMDPSYKDRITPDYEISTEDLFLNTSKILIQELPDLELLAHREDTRHRKLKDLPSWVPDFTVPTAKVLHRNTLNADSRVDSTPIIKFEESKLILRGVDVEMVKTVHSWETPDNASEDKAAVSISVNMMKHWFSAVRHLTDNETYTQDPLEVLWRTLIANETSPPGQPSISNSHFRSWMTHTILLMFDHINQMPEEQRISVEAVGSEFAPCESKPDPAMLRTLIDTRARVKSSLYPKEEDMAAIDIVAKQAIVFLTAMDMHSAQRQLYVTSAGLVGLGPVSMKPGDKVVFVDGARMMFIIRLKGTEFEMVGETYLHGFMDGEFLRGGILDAIDDIVIC